MWKKFLIAIAATFTVVTILITLPSDSGQSTLGSDGSLPYLSATRKANIKNAWLKYHPELPGWDLDFPYYGTYDGYDVFFVKGNTAAISDIKIAGQTFWCGSGFQIYAHAGGEFSHLKAAYENGLVSEESIAAVLEVHKIYNSVFYSEQLTLGVDGSLPYLSYGNETAIQNAWLVQTSEMLHWGIVDLSGGCLYYGTYDGYDVLFIRNEATGYQEVQIGRIMFSNNSSFLLVAHSNNTFYPLKQLYDNGQISDEAIAAAAKIHNIYHTE